MTQMQQIQLGLVDLETGEAFVPAREIIDEPEYSFKDLTQIAKNYGEELRRLQLAAKIDGKQLDAMVIAFVAGLQAASERELSTDECYWLKQNAFDAARPWAVSA
jgi:hypothetical protein